MKTYFYYLVAIALLLVGTGLLYLTNTGILNIGKSHVRKISTGLAPEASVVVFDKVNVIPMDRERVLVRLIVINRDGIIIHVGDSSDAAIPDGALVIDGTDRYLVPGNFFKKEEDEEEFKKIIKQAHLPYYRF